MTWTRSGAMARRPCARQPSAYRRAISSRSGATRVVGSISSARVRARAAGIWTMHSRSRISGCRTGSDHRPSMRRGGRLRQRKRQSLEPRNVDLEYHAHGALPQPRTLARRPAERIAITGGEAGIDIHQKGLRAGDDRRVEPHRHGELIPHRVRLAELPEISIEGRLAPGHVADEFRLEE